MIELKKYGIKFGNNEFGNFGHVQFGDGLTRIQSLGYSDGQCGVAMVRDMQDVPFGLIKPEDTDNALEVVKDKIILVFDNPKSIDVLIDRLIEAKGYMVSDSNQISNNTKEANLQDSLPEKELAQLIYCLEGRREDLSNDNNGDARNWIRHIDNAYSAMVDAIDNK